MFTVNTVELNPALYFTVSADSTVIVYLPSRFGVNASPLLITTSSTLIVIAPSVVGVTVIMT